jgi:hypothetical protein
LNPFHLSSKSTLGMHTPLECSKNPLLLFSSLLECFHTLLLYSHPPHGTFFHYLRMFKDLTRS